MTVLLANPNWPAAAFEMDFQTGPPNTPSGTRMSINNKLRRLTMRQFEVDRGRQYEMDQVQAGTFTGSIMDPLENLNTDNTGSVFNTGSNLITPYRSMWFWYLWPNQPGSGNIINTGVLSTYDPSFENNPGGFLGGWQAAGGTTTLAQSTAQHQDGTHALLVTQSAAGAGFGAVNSFRTVPDLTYVFSAYVFPTGGANVTIQVVDAAGTVWSSSTATTQNTWTRLSVSWNALDTLEKITVYGTGVTTPTFYVDATMLEFGNTVNTFTTTGPTFYTIYTGYAERFPTEYDMSGFRATKPVSCVDALAILSRTAIRQSYIQTVTADAPTSFAPLSLTKAPPSGGAMQVGAETAAIAGTSLAGNPFYSVAQQGGSLNWNGDQQPDGIGAVVIQQNNAYNPPKAGHVATAYPTEQQTAIDLTPAGIGSVKNTGATIEIWAKFSSGAAVVSQLLSTAVHGGGLNLELGYGASSTQNHLEIITIGGRLLVQICDAAASFDNFYDVSGSTIPNAGFPDGQWHYYAITFFDAGGGTPGIAITYDNVETDFGGPSGARNYGFSNWHNEATTEFGDATSQVSIARFAVYNYDIGATRRAAHYQRGIGYQGELSGARVARLLGVYWGGTTSVAAGFIGMAPDFSYDPTQDGSQSRGMLDVLQEIQATEGGQSLIFAAKDGTVTFHDRTSRYVAGQTSLWTFGENPSGGEFPYSAFADDVDPTYTFSQANLSRPSNSQFAPVVNATTEAAYGQRTLTQQMQVNYDFDLIQGGIFYDARYSKPAKRITKMLLRPCANPSLWPVVGSLELSQRITAKRRNAGLTISRDYYIEKITHRGNAEQSTWEVELQLSPVFITSAWVLGDSTFGILGTSTTPVY